MDPGGDDSRGAVASYFRGVIMDEDTDSLPGCPFCGAIPEAYDGDHRVKHLRGCFLYDGAEYQWLVGRKWTSWKCRVEGQRTSETRETSREDASMKDKGYEALFKHLTRKKRRVSR